MDNLGYLLAVFGIVWVVLFAYVLVLINGQKRLRKEIQNLYEIVKEKGIEKSL
jgi:CcmD family protein